MVSVDPITLEVARNRLAAIADEMGVVLRRTAYSPNIKERADCSAAIFVPSGEMLAQAEHIPVHLGSLPASVAPWTSRPSPHSVSSPGRPMCSPGSGFSVFVSA